ncbi:MAG: hypothetical protein JW940_39425 [Polyangiaceae bacterium]|nr:hypothetical protein [Polyangiaceae bacterium]
MTDVPSQKPAIYVVGNAYRHSSIQADPYTRKFTPFEQLGGQGYIWELVYGATRFLVEKGRVAKLSPSEDRKRRLPRDPHEKALSIDTGTTGWLEYYAAGDDRLSGQVVRARRLSGDFLRLKRDPNAPRAFRRRRPDRLENFHVTTKARSTTPRLLIVYDDGLGEKRAPDSGLGSREVGALVSLGREASPVVVQTDVAASLWHSLRLADDEVDVLSKKTLFVTRADVLSSAPGSTVASGEGLGIRTHLSLDTACRDLQRMIKHPSQAEMRGGKDLRLLLESFHHLLVRLDRHSAVYVARNGGRPTFTLLFDPKPELASGGYMLGYTSILTACLAKSWVLNETPSKWEEETIHAAVSESFLRGQRHFDVGFCPKRHVKAPANFGAWNTWVFFEDPDKKIPLCTKIVLPSPLEKSVFDCKLNDGREAKAKAKAERELAEDILTRGPVRPLTEQGLPFTRIGKYVLIEPEEIDAFSSLRLLLGAHMQNASATRPFNIAVFGAPGSGKSFGVEQVAESLQEAGLGATAPKVEKVEVNLSQLRTSQDLCVAFHRVRDELLGGKVPLVFFDEFDTSLQGKPYGWLRWFLAPMQDGKFLDGESQYNLGRPIFVFAGGVNRSFSEMSSRVRAPEFAEAKGPDFISRLRWYVDIPGIEAPDESGKPRLHRVRRAILIRGILEKLGRWRRDEVTKAPLDAAMTRAFLETSRFRHGVRSIEAILAMCQGEPGMPLRMMHLPPEGLLNMHVDAREFLGLAAAAGTQARAAGTSYRPKTHCPGVDQLDREGERPVADSGEDIS